LGKSDIAGEIIDKLYSFFLLRDFLGKIVPGSLMLAIFWGTLTSQSIKEIFSQLYSHPPNILVCLLLAGISWIAAFFAQEIGTITRLISIDTPNKTIFDILYKKGDKEEIREKIKQIERISVIKETSGNMSIVLLLLSIIDIISKHLLLWGSEGGQWLSRLGCFAIAFIFLIRNGRAADEQRDMENLLIEWTSKFDEMEPKYSPAFSQIISRFFWRIPIRSKVEEKIIKQKKKENKRL
jgi:hypothetical protein